LTAANKTKEDTLMTKKLYALISALIEAAEIAGCALLAYFQPNMYLAYIAAIGIGTKAVDEILLLFVKDK
jgi:hypothetical protein